MTSNLHPELEPVLEGINILAPESMPFDDVLVIQISGENVWSIFTPQQRRYAGIDNLSAEQMGSKIEELTMRPGDVLYVRAGVPHVCRTSADHSLHLAFDLIDNTSNPKQITDEANRVYECASADAFLPPTQVMDRYIEILKSPESQASLRDGAQGMKDGARNVRETIGKASALDAVSKYI